ncbi:hypothetical protein BRARA_J02939 [Brassica rapa]|uniref:DUF7900 domain-containing protein n=1 Tax=Brassica campestris TaxID=3711 RepID=A0A397XUE0_BRACM|nr:uncharacterized protein LOC111212999 [Brassica napus]XP_048629988.1 uncharacterized protein LOC125602349 [Brassica napus]RID43114.1 hypothetical protein BRARA_J02939 [Brassica rapa]
MGKSEGSSSGAISSSKKKNEGPLCHCKRRTSMAKAWTNDNPGRRFWLCNPHGFVAWIDLEEQNGWQKQSLLEARDVMDRLREEIKVLKQSPWTTSQQATIEDSTALLLEEGDRLAEEKKKLEIALITSVEKEKLLRQFLILSWGGFIVITIIIVFAMLKK